MIITKKIGMYKMKDITKKLQKLAKTRNKKVIVIKKGSVKYRNSNSSTSNDEDYISYSENN